MHPINGPPAAAAAPWHRPSPTSSPAAPLPAPSLPPPPSRRKRPPTSTASRSPAPTSRAPTPRHRRRCGGDPKSTAPARPRWPSTCRPSPPMAPARFPDLRQRFRRGGAGISALGAGSTLVLLNGRRMTYGLADDGQKVFTDLSTIPLDAVERVEDPEGRRFGDLWLRCHRGQHHPAQRLPGRHPARGSYGLSGDSDGDAGRQP